jgi:F0F1-type ATP synthase assembly protein I
VPEKPPTMNLPTLLGVGAAFGVIVGIGVFLGVLGDHAWGTSPLLALLGLAVGILGGAASAYQVIRPFTRNSPAATPKTQSARPDDSADQRQVRSDEQ